jgi:isocitrate dehydrogenase kinase/phosphatase
VRTTDPIRVAEAAAIILEGFNRYVGRFREVTRRAGGHFARRDWAALHDDSVRRLDLYGEQLAWTLAALQPLLGDRLWDRQAWAELRGAYASEIAGGPAAELAETYFNSITRRLFATIGVDPEIEFVRREAAPPVPEGASKSTVVLDGPGEIRPRVGLLFDRLLGKLEVEDRAGDAARIAAALEDALQGRELRSLELAPTLFFRGQRAFVVGRALHEGGALPLLIAFANPRGKLVADAVLLDENEISIVFSFARAYFLVDAERPRDLVGFLRTIMPRKPVNELYNAIGWDKHGKTELYRSLLRHLESTDDRFEIAPGQRGMVRRLHTLPASTWWPRDPRPVRSAQTAPRGRRIPPAPATAAGAGWTRGVGRLGSGPRPLRPAPARCSCALPPPPSPSRATGWWCGISTPSAGFDRSTSTCVRPTPRGRGRPSSTTGGRCGISPPPTSSPATCCSRTSASPATGG